MECTFTCSRVGFFRSIKKFPTPEILDPYTLARPCPGMRSNVMSWFQELLNAYHEITAVAIEISPVPHYASTTRRINNYNIPTCIVIKVHAAHFIGRRLWTLYGATKIIVNRQQFNRIVEYYNVDMYFCRFTTIHPPQKCDAFFFSKNQRL